MENTLTDPQVAKSYKSIVPQGNYIDGKWLQGNDNNTLKIIDKYDGSLIQEVPMADEAQMEQALSASVQAFEEMKSWSAGKRASMLQLLHSKLKEKRNLFADLIVAEAGKPISYALNEVDRCLVTIETAITESVRFGGEYIPMDFAAGEGKTAFTKRFPIGPIACISPFNFPLNLALHKIAPALAVGCSVVLKPAPQAPLSCMAFAELCHQAGYPAGAINVLACDIPVAEKLVTDERMKMLSFTGSPQVGWHLKNIAGRKKVVLELGGNAAVIVDETANIEEAAKLTAKGAYLYAGQICISTQRIFVQESVYDQFAKTLLKEIENLKTGDPTKQDVLVGPVIDRGHLNRIAQWVDEAREKGAQVLTGGNVIDEAHNLYAPTLLTGTNKDMKVVWEEVFGPVAVIEKVKTFAEALEKTNDSQFGLQAGIFTNNLDRMKLAHEELEVGGIMINNIPGFRIDSMPYGGVKSSGLGREGIKYAMEEMTEARLLVY